MGKSHFFYSLGQLYIHIYLDELNKYSDIEMDIANDAKRVLELARAGNGGDEILSRSKSIVAAMRKRETVIRSILFARG